MVVFSFVYITLYTSTYVVAVMFRLSTIYETKRTKNNYSEIQRSRFGACTARRPELGVLGRRAEISVCAVEVLRTLFRDRRGGGRFPGFGDASTFVVEDQLWTSVTSSLIGPSEHRAGGYCTLLAGAGHCRKRRRTWSERANLLDP